MFDSASTLADYLAALASRPSPVYSATTLNLYRATCARFLVALPDACSDPPSASDLLAAWRSFTSLSGLLRPRTLRVYRQIIVLFLDWCVAAGRLASHPLRSVVLPGMDAPDRPKVTLSRFTALLAAASALPSPFHCCRARALLYVAFTALLRREELLHLHVEHLRLDDDPPRLLVEGGKGGKSCWLPLSDSCVAALRAWLRVRPDAPHSFLWCHQGERRLRLSHGALLALLSRLARAAGLDPADCVPHALRRGGATCMLQSGVDIGTVSKMLRHARLSTSEDYVEADTQRLAAVRNWLDAPDPAPQQAEPPAARVCRDPALRPPAQVRRRLPPIR